MRVERVYVQHRHAGLARRRAQGGILQQRHLGARPAEALHAVAGAAQQQQAGGVGRAVTHHVHGQGLAIAAQHRVGMALHIEAGGFGGGQELAARLPVALREGVDAWHGLQRGVFSQVSASRTQAVAPSGIRSSLKS